MHRNQQSLGRATILFIPTSLFASGCIISSLPPLHADSGDEQNITAFVARPTREVAYEELQVSRGIIEERLHIIDVSATVRITSQERLSVALNKTPANEPLLDETLRQTRVEVRVGELTAFNNDAGIASVYSTPACSGIDPMLDVGRVEIPHTAAAISSS